MTAPALLQQNPIVVWWHDHIVATVDHVRVLDRVRGESGWSGRYAFMTLMSAGIAVLGLLLSSPAVVIGAMLISPLMGPIIGLGFGLATFDSAEIRESAVALALGVVLAVIFCALIVLMSPLQNVTEEIAARTQPNLFDLLVALFSALAGSYAMVRGREGTIVGVAIATALMPPLAVMGYGLATLNWTVFTGSTILFFTNLMTIALAAAGMARLYGFGSDLSPQHTILQTVLMVATLIAFAVPLGLSLRQIAWEATAQRDVRDVVASQFGDDSRISQIDVKYDPIRVDATVLTPQFESDAERDAQTTLTRLFGEPVTVTLEQYRVSTGAAAEAQQIAAAQANARRQAADQAAAQLVRQLALVAGVEPGSVLLDRDHRRAVVNAQPLPDTGLAAYRALEARVAKVASDWSVEVVPPAAPLPEIGFTEPPKQEAQSEQESANVLSDAGEQALQLVIWAGRRVKAPIGVSGPDAHVGTVVTTLTRAGVSAHRVDGPGGSDGAVTLRWLAPDDE
ncbi:DUF389 domain-containing protein [Stakelama saccharophila]|uniref:DUF389 domain-containing protein n=1 Tax=Stakelama saccharophila TaxID=3075605 RepID=A0ABZ0B8Y5_9SPHN|nr:DUF389 domain-containing protein [Stakelama sp. W311]WNO53745.1 DUF389 domain-containing protein [Stakelama sp. W311]